MAEEGKSRSVQVAAAALGLIGILGTACTANPPARSTLAAATAKEDAEKVTARWVEAWQAGDVATLVELSNPPFFLDQKILTSTDDVRFMYEAGVRRSGSARLTVERTMSGSIGEFKRLGHITADDRLLSQVELSDDDLVVILIVSADGLSEEGIGFYFRRLSDRVEMAGFWD